MTELDWVHGDPVELRLAYAAERAALDATAPRDVAVVAAQDGDALCFTPEGGGQGAPILYFHGGSWMVGSPHTHRALCAWLSKLTNRRVLSVSYPLAPEHPYPAQRDAARSQLNAMLTSEDGPVFVAGDSAGGAMALWAAGAQTAGVNGVATFYPAYGVLQSTSIDAHGPGNPALNATSIAAMYARLGVDPKALRDDMPLEGAPLLIIAAQCDPLRDDSIELAQAMRARDVTLWEAEGQEHAFLHHGGAQPDVRAWLTKVGGWMSAQEAHHDP